jgi:hypothetical protein
MNRGAQTSSYGAGGEVLPLDRRRDNLNGQFKCHGQM